MKYAIRYYSKTGNTKKLADALSELLNVPALDISHPLTEDVDKLFFGSGVYGCSLDPEVISFVGNIEVNVGDFVNFSTSGIMESNYELMKDVLSNTNISLSSFEFHCPGSFVGMNEDRPNEEDVRKFIDSIKNFLK